MYKAYVHTYSFYIYMFSAVCTVLLRESSKILQRFFLFPCMEKKIHRLPKWIPILLSKMQEIKLYRLFLYFLNIYFAVMALAQHKREHTDSQATLLYSSLLTSLELSHSSLV